MDVIQNHTQKKNKQTNLKSDMVYQLTDIASRFKMSFSPAEVPTTFAVRTVLLTSR